MFMSLRDIAELADVHRPVVTTWRRRHKDFPAPEAGDAAQPLFDSHRVAEWLIGTGRAKRPDMLADLSVFTLAGLGRVMPPRTLIATVTALICLRHLDGDDLDDGIGTGSLRDRAVAVDPDDNLLLSEIAELPRDAAGVIATAVDDLVEAAWDCARAFERIMEARHRFYAAEIAAGAAAPHLAALIAGLSGAKERADRKEEPVVVCDPNAGPGDLLTAVTELLGRDYVPACTAADPDPYLARLTRRRLVVHGLDLRDMDVYVSDTLPDESGEPDVLVTQLPYVPAEDRDAERVLDTVGDIAVRLRQGCTAVVLGPANVLFDELPPLKQAERTRARLLAEGFVEAVIRLPRGLVPFRPWYETALWVLTSPSAGHGRNSLLIADISDREFTDAVADGLVTDVITWRRAGYDPAAHQREFAVPVPVPDPSDGMPVTLSVRPPQNPRTINDEATERLGRVVTLESDLDKLAVAAVTHVHSTAVADVHPRPPQRSVSHLVRERVVKLGKGIRLRTEDVGSDGHYAVFGSDEVLGLRRPGTRKIDRVVLAERYQHASLTEPGDVLVTSAPRFGITVDVAGLAVVETPVRVLRITKDGRALLTPRVLAQLLASGGRNTSFGISKEHRRVEEHHVAALDARTVERLDGLLTTMAERRTRRQQEIDMLDELREIVAAGLIDGTLALAGDLP